MYVSEYVSIYLQPFTSYMYSEILVGNCNFFLPAPLGCFHWNSRKSLDLRKLEPWSYQAVKTV